MNNFLTLDLRVARRKAGLTQADLAHLLDIDADRISRIERGLLDYSVHEFLLLCAIYDRPLDGLARALWPETYESLAKRLASLPAPATPWINTYNRQHTLERLTKQLPAKLGRHAAQ